MFWCFRVLADSEVLHTLLRYFSQTAGKQNSEEFTPLSFLKDLPNL